jgi:hypothetical protein
MPATADALASSGTTHRKIVVYDPLRYNWDEPLRSSIVSLTVSLGKHSCSPTLLCLYTDGHFFSMYATRTYFFLVIFFSIASSPHKWVYALTSIMFDYSPIRKRLYLNDNKQIFAVENRDDRLVIYLLECMTLPSKKTRWREKSTWLDPVIESSVLSFYRSSKDQISTYAIHVFDKQNIVERRGIDSNMEMKYLSNSSSKHK